MNENNERTFDLGTVLTITSERVFTDINNIYDILNYLTNSQIFSHQMPQVMKIAKYYVLKKYPQLDGIGKDVIINSEQDAKRFIDEQKGIYGNSFSLSPMNEEMYRYSDSIKKNLNNFSSKTKTR